MNDIRDIAITKITPSLTNPRKTFDEQKLIELAKSIKAQGILQPILVRPLKGFPDMFEIIAGERRFRAGRKAKLITIPCIVRDLSDKDVLEIQLIENIQREDPNPMETCEAVNCLKNELDLDINEICKKVSLSEAAVYHMLRVARACEDLKHSLREGYITYSVATVLSALDISQQQICVEELSREKKENLVSTAKAREYIRIKFRHRKPRKGRTATEKAKGNDFCERWKWYLVRFTPKQFLRFQEIVKGRTETDTLSQAVEVVMIEESPVTVAGGNSYAALDQSV